jgi:hypothetical protein
MGDCKECKELKEMEDAFLVGITFSSCVFILAHCQSKTEAWVDLSQYRERLDRATVTA